jgi:hypothetical protein
MRRVRGVPGMPPEHLGDPGQRERRLEEADGSGNAISEGVQENKLRLVGEVAASVPPGTTPRPGMENTAGRLSQGRRSRP